MLPEVTEWGIKINIASVEEIVDEAVRLLESGRKGVQITGVNAENASFLPICPVLRDAMNASDIVNIDGVGVALALKLYGYKKVGRATCPAVFESLLRVATARNQTIYLLGGTSEVVERMVETLKSEHPGIKIVGYRNGYFDEREEKRIVEEIAGLSPDYLFLGLPTPKKESFALKYKSVLNTGLIYGIGGVFDIKGGAIKRAPRFFQIFGIEWVYRSMQNPKNYGMRCIRSYPRFLRIVANRRRYKNPMHDQ